MDTKFEGRRSLFLSILLAAFLCICAANVAVEFPCTNFQEYLTNDKENQQPKMVFAVEELIRFLNDSNLPLYASGLPPNSSIFEQAEVMGGGKVMKEKELGKNACAAVAKFFANPRQALLRKAAKTFQDIVHFFEGENRFWNSILKERLHRCYTYLFSLSTYLPMPITRTSMHLFM